MLTANIQHSLADIRRDEWDAMARGEDIQLSYEYQKYMEELDPRHRILVECRTAEGRLTGILGSVLDVTADEPAFFNRPWDLLGADQFLRVDEALMPLELALAGRAPDLPSQRERLRQLLEPTLFLRQIWDSRPLLDGGEGPGSRAATDCLLRGLLSHAATRGSRAVMLPFVDPADQVLTSSLRALGFLEAHIVSAAVFDLGAFNTFEDFLASLPRRARQLHHQDLRGFAAAGHMIREEPIAKVATTIAELEVRTASRHGGDLSVDDVAGANLALGRWLGDRAVVLCSYDGERLASFSMLLQDPKRWYGYVFGRDYDLASSRAAYGKLGFCEPIARAIKARVPELAVGFEEYDAKLRRGAQLRPRHTFLWIRDPAAREELRPWMAMVDARNRVYFAGLADHYHLPAASQ